MLKRYEVIKQEHITVYEVILELREHAASFTMEDSTDIAFLLRQMAEYCDDLRKEMTKVRQFIEKVTCMKWMQASMNEDPDKAAQPIRGELAIGTPQLKTMVVLPNREKDPVSFAKFMKRIGVFGSALKWNMVRVHWPAVIDYISHLNEKGRPLPPGINPSQTYPMYRLVLRERKGMENSNGKEKDSSNCEG